MKYKKGRVLFLLLACAIIFLSMINSPEKRTLRYFKNYRAALEIEALNFIESGQIRNDVNIPFDYWDGEHPIVEWVVVGSGVVPASKYYGFFYSFDDQPVSFQNAGEPLVPISEQEWEWSGEGDNHDVVRRLDTNWFYFEAAL